MPERITTKRDDTPLYSFTGNFENHKICYYQNINEN